VKEEILVQAKALRSQGLSYQQIVEKMDGQVTLDQCKKNLKGVNKPKQNDACVSEIIALGLRPEGVTEYEATGVVFKHHPNASKDKVRYAKKKARENKECLIHSGWIDHMKPTESHKSMNAYVLHLMDQLDLLVEDYMYSYPNSNKWSVKYEMLKLAFSSKISPEPLSGRLYRNELLAEEMENRLQK
jgi:hypothetical protein